MDTEKDRESAYLDPDVRTLSTTAAQIQRHRSKTPLRLKYEAEIAVLKRDLGGLEEVRIKLGLSRRKICQILMVDPSAWTRWTCGTGDAPPHIYQALRWYLDAKTTQSNKLEGYWEELKEANRSLHEKVTLVQAQHRRLQLYLIGMSLLGCALLLYIVWRAFHPVDFLPY